MKLVKCYVSSFGKLKDFSYDFNSQLNTFKEDNGWGKSTLATFIKAMFYGLVSGKRNVNENERIKYRPWNTTERFGGSIWFEKDGKVYKLERFFGTKEAEDTVRLFDEETGKEFSKTENLGHRLFQIDEEGFLSTTYFSQKDFQVKSNTSITAKFNSVCEIEFSDTFDDALKRVENKAKEYKYRGDKGLISDVKKEIFSVDESIIQAKKSADAISQMKAEAKQLELKVAELKKQSTILTEQVADAGRAEALTVKKARYDELTAQKQSLQAKQANFDRIFNGKVPERGELVAYIEANRDLESAVAAHSAVKNDLATLELPKKEKTNIKPLAFCAVAVIALILAVVFAITQGFLSALTIIFSILFIISAILTATVAFGKKENSGQYSVLIERKRNELNEYSEIISKYAEKIDSFISRFNLNGFYNRRDALNAILKATEERERLVAEITAVDNALKGFDKEKDSFNEIGLVSNKNLEALNIDLARVNEAYSFAASNLANKQASIKAQENYANSIADLESKRSELVANLAEYVENYNILILTAEYLKKADENLKVKYRAPLQNSLNKYLALIGGGNISAQIDIDLNVTINEKDGSKVPEYYSKGYQNLFEICKRFALTDVLFKGEKPFIILDDPFYNLDDEKLSAALELVEKLSKEYQIIYFVCHESRRV